jgi:hypothetical protein
VQAAHVVGVHAGQVTGVTGEQAHCDSNFEKNRIGYVAFITTGTPLVQVAVARTSDVTVVLSAYTPPKVVLA